VIGRTLALAFHSPSLRTHLITTPVPRAALCASGGFEVFVWAAEDWVLGDVIKGLVSRVRRTNDAG
jgi:hypothetical protein